MPEPSDARREPDPPLAPSPKAARERAEAIPAATRSAGVESIADAVVIKAGEPFFLCPPDGQIPILRGHGYGLYHHDTRFLSGYELTKRGPMAMLNGRLTPVVSVAAMALAFVAMGVRSMPMSRVMELGFVLLTAYTGPIGALLYVLGCREPLPELHATLRRAGARCSARPCLAWRAMVSGSLPVRSLRRI